MDEDNGMRITEHECAACGDRLYDVHLVGPGGIRVCDPDCADAYDAAQGRDTVVTL